MYLQKLRVATVAAVAVALLLSACGGADDDGAQADEARSAPTPVVTVAQAQRLLDRYSRVNNRANRERDAGLLATVEGGRLFEQSSAQYEQLPTWSREGRERYGKPFHYVNPRFHIPADANWFMVTAGVKGQGFDRNDRHLLVLERERAGGDWKTVVAINTTSDRLPEVSRDRNGLAAVVPETHKTGSLALNDLDDAVNDIYISGGRRTGRHLDATTETARQIHSDHDQRSRGLTCARAEFKPARIESKIYALKTEDGGTLAAFNSADDKVLFGITPDCYIIPSDQAKLYIDERRPRAITERFQNQNLAHVPTRGKVDLLGADVQLIRARPGGRGSARRYREVPPAR